MFKKRLFSGIVVAAVIIGATLLGGMCLIAVLLLSSLVGMYEFYRAVGVLDGSRRIDLITGISYAFMILYYALLYLTDERFFHMIFAVSLYLLVLLAAYVFTFPKYNAKDIIFTCFGFFYVGVMISFMFLTRSLDDGIYVAWLILAGSWLCDVFAYFTGMLCGKHRLCPNLSPKKSVEGAVGGVVFPAIVAGIFGYIIGRYYSPDYPIVPVFALLTAVGAAASQLGDLSASAIKRNYDIKDYGDIIPGHGGILDRFDSMIFVAPLVYFIALYLTKGY